MPGPFLRRLLCLILLLPLLGGGGGALAGLVEDWRPAASPAAPVHPPKSGGCCGAMAAGMAQAMAGGDGCGCPVDAPCRVQAAPIHPAQSALLAASAWSDAPAPALAALVQAEAQPTPHRSAPRRNPDPPPQARYLRLAVLRI